jgi:hypothetical protein
MALPLASSAIGNGMAAQAGPRERARTVARRDDADQLALPIEDEAAPGRRR